MTSRNNFRSEEATVNNGFPILFWFDIRPPEPESGIMYPFVDDYYITTRGGKPCPWLKVSDEEIARLIEECGK